MYCGDLAGGAGGGGVYMDEFWRRDARVVETGGSSSGKGVDSSEACFLRKRARSINWLCETGFPGFGSASEGSLGRWNSAKWSGDSCSARARARTIPGVMVSSTIAACVGMWECRSLEVALPLSE
jgi:hypothetical protein